MLVNVEILETAGAKLGLKGYLQQLYEAGRQKDRITGYNQEPIVVFAADPFPPAFPSVPERFHKICKEDEEHDRIFNAVEVVPEDAQKRQKPQQFPFFL